MTKEYIRVTIVNHLQYTDILQISKYLESAMGDYVETIASVSYEKSPEGLVKKYPPRRIQELVKIATEFNELLALLIIFLFIL